MTDEPERPAPPVEPPADQPEPQPDCETERIGVFEPPSVADQTRPLRPPPAPVIEPPPAEEPPAEEPAAAPPTPPLERPPAREPEPLPRVEDITFEPRAPATLSPSSGPSIAISPRTLPKRRAFTLAAFAEALLPQGGPIPFGATEVRVAERLDASMAVWDPGARRTFERALHWFEWSSVFSRHLLPFSRLKPHARAAYVERETRSRALPRRAAAELLRRFCSNQWASTAPVEQALGFTYSCESKEPARDGERLEILSYPQISRDHVEECDVVVIGSGAGGAVVAKEMAEIGLSVIVLEEGSSFTRRDFTGPPFERLQRMYRRNGTATAFGSPMVALPQGMAVGGSTIVSEGTCFRTPDRVLQRWEKDHGLPGADPESMRVFFERVERIQHVQPVPEDLLGQNGRLFRRGVERLSLHGAPLSRAIDGCRGCGVCSFGCPSDANLSTHLTYLPRAQRNGATIYANARAGRIVVEGGRARGVVAALLDPRTRQPRASLTVRAKMVVVAAGAIHTPALLAANALGNHSGELGRNLRLYPSASVGAFFEQDVHPWRGTPQAFSVDDFHESHDVMIHATASVPGAGAGTFQAAGPRLKEMLSSYPQLASANVFVTDTSRGRVIRRRGEPLVTYSLNAHDTRRMVRGIVKAAEIFIAAGARGVLTGLPDTGVITTKTQLDELREDDVRAGGLMLTGFNPTGTARMGADPQTSVTGPFGEVHGVGGLFVADASVLPGSPTVNPQITVMAFATRSADHIARHASRYF